MMITVLAAAMMILMLIATVVALHNETEQAKFKEQARKTRGFGTY